jgi:hypothetical protein
VVWATWSESVSQLGASQFMPGCWSAQGTFPGVTRHLLPRTAAGCLAFSLSTPFLRAGYDFMRGGKVEYSMRGQTVRKPLIRERR